MDRTQLLIGVAVALFSLGLVGVIVRRNVLVMLMCMELMLNGVNLSLVTFAQQTSTTVGAVLVFLDLRRRDGRDRARDPDRAAAGAHQAHARPRRLQRPQGLGRHAMLTAIVLLPLLGFVLNGLLATRLGGNRVGPRFVSVVGCGLPIVSFVLVVKALLDLRAGGWAPLVEIAYRWALIGDSTFEIAFYFDRLSAVMALVVTGVGSLIHIYSIGYMKDDEGYGRYFAYLNLFLFFMLLLVLGRSLLVLFVGWEGVGLASYLLIGFWFDDLANARAGKKAFVTNRIGDAGFLLGMFVLYQAFGTLDMDRINAAFSGAGAARGLGEPGRRPALHRRHRQVGADSAARLAARRDGRPDAGLGADPRGDDGDRRRLPGARGCPAVYLHAPEASPLIAVVGVATAFFAATIARRPDRHQEGARLLDHLAARLHVPRARRRRLRRGDLPPRHPRLLQGLPLPRRRQRDPRARRRAGHAQAWAGWRAASRSPSGPSRSRPPRSPASRRSPASSRRTRSSGSRSRARAAARRCSGVVAAATALMTAFYMFRLLWLTFFGRSRMTRRGRAPRARVAAVDDRRAGRCSPSLSAIGGFLADAALPRAAAAAAARSTSARALRDAAARRLGRARAGRPRRAPRGCSAAAAERAERLRARFAGAAPLALGQVLRRRALRALHRQAAALDLRPRLPALRRPRACSTARCTAWPRSAAAAPRVFGRVQTGSLHLYALARAGRHRRRAALELAPCLTPAVLNVVLFLPLLGIAALHRRRAARATGVRAPPGARGDGRAVRARGVALRALRQHAVAGLQFETRLPWIAAWGVYYQIGLDGYNVLLVMLTAFLGPLVVAGAFTAIAKDVKLFYAMVFAGPVRDDRHLRRAGPVPVLSLLGDDADPDVPASSASGAASGASTRRSSSCSTPPSAASSCSPR